MADAGYDVADYRDIEPAYGTLDEAQALIAEAHELGIRVMLDIVPNHTSDEHAWFRAALADEPGARQRYHFRPGRGADGALPPNNWQSVFGGPAWTQVADGSVVSASVRPRSARPQLGTRRGARRVRGHPGVLVRPGRRRLPHRRGARSGQGSRTARRAATRTTPRRPCVESRAGHPAWDQDGVHEVYRGWRSVADRYSPERIFIAEAWVPSNERLARYLRPDELHTAFQFDFLRAPWRAEILRAVVDDAIGAAATVGAPPTWVLSNHDVTRTVTRFARSQPPHLVGTDWERGRWADEDPDHALGRRRARAAALVQLALPGTAYVYQGEELALEEVEDLPDEVRQDPTWVAVRLHRCRARRLPYPVAVDATSARAVRIFARRRHQTWLPQPAHWGEHSVEAQDRDPDSTLNLYRAALRLRPLAVA